MKAIILAAGRGSRMKHLTDKRPKCLLRLGDKTLLDMQLHALREAGIYDIAIVTGYRRELLTHYKLVEFHNARWSQTNMFSSLLEAKSWLELHPCIVSYSDIFYDPSAVQSLAEDNASLAITYDPNWLSLWSQRFEDPLSDAETFGLTPEHNLAEIGNKPTCLAEVQGQYMGLLRFTPKGWDEIFRIYRELRPQQRDSLHMTGALQKLILANNIPIKAIPYYGRWGECDSENDLRTYQDIE